ncbi:MAG TPA: proline--tRNA ligase [archaeon]|nr:proline--tRNA ligase [archaeon]HPV66371.1 proline--tRNA ligase [archaeon]
MASSEELKIKDFNEWFIDINQRAELADLRYNIKGVVVYRPWSTFTINKMFRLFEDAFDETAHQQVILPTLIPEENFYKEAEHVEGFTPEVFWVTEHGNEKLEQRYALRPTSETAFYYMFAYWLESYRDLPIKTYQRANVFRYDTKQTKPFFRGREFYWFETHNIFETYEDSYAQVLQDMQITEDIIHLELGIPFIFFKRPQWDKFAGAEDTFAADTMMPNGKACQIATTHLLGQKFTKTFNVKFRDKDEETKIPYGTCYGPGVTRIYGSLIGIHGDQNGLRLPFELAPIQIIIVPLYFSGEDPEALEHLCVDFANDLDKLGYRVKIDDNKEKKPKERFSFYEMKGVPIRIEIGPKDLEESQVVLFRRDLNTKEKILFTDLFENVKKISMEFTDNLREQADNDFDDALSVANTKEELISEINKGKLVRIPFCSIDPDGKECFDELKAATAGGEVRGTRMDIKEVPDLDEQCVICGNKAKHYVYIARSY